MTHGILSMLGLSGSTGGKKRKIKKLPKFPKGLVARAKRKQASKKRDAEIVKRKKEIEALRKAANG